MIEVKFEKTFSAREIGREFANWDSVRQAQFLLGIFDATSKERDWPGGYVKWELQCSYIYYSIKKLGDEDIDRAVKMASGFGQIAYEHELRDEDAKTTKDSSEGSKAERPTPDSQLDNAAPASLLPHVL